MDIELSKEQRSLQARSREYFMGLMTPERQIELRPSPEGEYGHPETYRKFVRQIADDGWLGLGWPKEFGGQGLSMLEQLIVADEAYAAGVPLPTLALTTVGPTLMRYGSDEQKETLLPAILRGELLIAIGYSEPDAGTDLASLRTSAVKDGDEYVINGTKMWTSLMEYADYVWLAARTDRDAPKHKGITIFLVPRDSKGVAWSQVRTLPQVTNISTYDDVRVPASAIVGGENRGWSLITSQLNHERVMIGSASRVQRLLRDTVSWSQSATLADGSRVFDQEAVRLQLARVHAEVEYVKLLNWRVCAEGDVGPAVASATKVYGSESQIRACELLMEVLGAEGALVPGSPGALLHGRLAESCLQILLFTYGGGTNEVQRDIIAMTGLQLPRSER